MMLFMLLGLPLLYLLENNDRLDAARIYALRHVILVSLGASLVAAGLRMVFDSFLALDYFWFQSVLWFLVADWLIPAAITIAVHALFRQKRTYHGPEEALQGLQTIFLFVFWVCLMVRLASRLNQLEYQDIFMYPGLLFGVMALLPILNRLGASGRIGLAATSIISLLAVVMGVAIQAFSHMNAGLPAFVLLGLFLGAVLFFRSPFGSRLLFPSAPEIASGNDGA